MTPIETLVCTAVTLVSFASMTANIASQTAAGTARKAAAASFQESMHVLTEAATNARAAGVG